MTEPISVCVRRLTSVTPLGVIFVLSLGPIRFNGSLSSFLFSFSQILLCFSLWTNQGKPEPDTAEARRSISVPSESWKFAHRFERWLMTEQSLLSPCLDSNNPRSVPCSQELKSIQQSLTHLTFCIKVTQEQKKESGRPESRAFFSPCVLLRRVSLKGNSRSHSLKTQHTAPRICPT